MIIRSVFVLTLLLGLCWNALGQRVHADEIRIGAKAFTESVILAEVLAQLAQPSGCDVETITLGGTPVVWQALINGEIDAYVEYTGTLQQEILKSEWDESPRLDQEILNLESLAGFEQLRTLLAKYGLRMSRPLGFNNTYALAISADWAAAHPQVRTISDLAKVDVVHYGFGNEFMDRGDGWPALCLAYNLPITAARGLDHDLAYRGLDSGTIDVMDVYTTDAEIATYDLIVLEDDRQFFPKYEAVILFREELVDQQPQAVAAWQKIEGTISAETMIGLNARAKRDQQPEPLVAADFLRSSLGINGEVTIESRPQRLWRYTIEHLWLVGVSITLAIVIAVPLGVVAAKRERCGQVVLAVVGILQTIPSLVLFVLFIPLLGVGPTPAICALFLYSLLPIVRGTHAGLVSIPDSLQESALALGLPPLSRLRLIELPLATRSILSGIKTAAVINVGTATLGGFISAGGYGEPIFRGIRLARNDLLLEGAIPAAMMALAAQAVFDLIERVAIPDQRS